MDDDGATAPPMAVLVARSLKRKFRVYVDRIVIYPRARWLGLLAFVLLYLYRTYLLRGWYIVTYGLGIYFLNLTIGFLSPKIDPETMGPILPTGASEGKGFQRMLPEFKFWYAATKGTMIASGMTFFSAFNVPVYWPILVMYFFTLFTLSAKQRIRHMIKYRYLPFDFRSKPVYGD